MKYLKQFWIIITITFIGEMLHHFIPLPVPASIYGLILMFTCLSTKVVKVEHVKHSSSLLLEIMPLMFVPPAVGLIEVWPVLKPIILQLVVIVFVTTTVVMVVSGRVTQRVIKIKEGK